MKIERSQVRAGITALGVTGVITMGPECEQLGREIDGLLLKNERKIILDLSAVSRMDSAGLGKIVFCLARLRKNGGDLRVAGAKGIVADAFKLTAVDKVIGLYPTRTAAAEDF